MDKGTERQGALEKRKGKGTGEKKVGVAERKDQILNVSSEQKELREAKATTQKMYTAGLCFDVMLLLCGVTAETSCWRQVPTRRFSGFYGNL